MKKLLIAMMMMVVFAAGCANTGYYNTQRGAAIGAGLGALAGQAVGRDTESTLIGAGVGGLMGTVIGNGMDQQALQYRENEYRNRYRADNHRRESRRSYHRSSANGRWVDIPGHWEGSVWVPGRTVWKPYY